MARRPDARLEHPLPPGELPLVQRARPRRPPLANRRRAPRCREQRGARAQLPQSRRRLLEELARLIASQATECTLAQLTDSLAAHTERGTDLLERHRLVTTQPIIH